MRKSAGVRRGKHTRIAVCLVHSRWDIAGRRKVYRAGGDDEIVGHLRRPGGFSDRIVECDEASRMLDRVVA
jgi:hypothetical protein